jgi:hypothetical protein
MNANVLESIEGFREKWPFTARYARVNGWRMHYVDEGAGDPIMLLHGNPTWGFLYRDVVAPLVDAGYRAHAAPSGLNEPPRLGLEGEGQAADAEPVAEATDGAEIANRERAVRKLGDGVMKRQQRILKIETVQPIVGSPVVARKAFNTLQEILQCHAEWFAFDASGPRSRFRLVDLQNVGRRQRNPDRLRPTLARGGILATDLELALASQWPGQ